MVSEETPARPPEVLQRAGSHAPDVTRALRRIARRRVLADGVWKTVAALAAPLAAAALLAGRFQEGTVFWTLTAAILASLGALAFSLRNALRRNSLRSLCKLYQLDCPEDECALDAAIELEAASTQPTDFQREYLALLQKRYLSKDSPLDKSPRLRPRLRLPLLALSLLALFALGRAGAESWRDWGCTLLGKSAIQIRLADTLLPVHQDLPVEARLLRHASASPVFLESVRGNDDTPRRERMTPAADGLWKLTIYDLTEQTRLRVVTPRATSRWLEVGVYLPPAPLEVSLRTTPPEYTGREPRSFTEFSDIDVVEGEVLSATCRMPEGEHWRLQEADSKSAVDPAAFAPERTTRYLAIFENSLERRTQTEFAVTVHPDLPPIVELIAPKEDDELPAGETAALSAKVSDDFGVANVTLHWTVDDSPENIVQLWEEPPRHSLEVKTTLDFGDVTPGQIVTGWLEATDNRDGTPPIARSTLFFLTVVPPRQDSNTPPSEPSPGDAQRHEVNVDDLVAECKRHLRETQTLLNRQQYLTEEELRQSRDGLSKELRALALAVSGRQVAIARSAGVRELPPEMRDFFLGAVTALESAASHVDSGAIALSRRPQSSALSLLTRLSYLLKQNAQMMAQASGGSSGEEGGSQGGESSQRLEKGDRNFSLDELQKALEETRRIRQEHSRLLGKGLTPEDAPSESDLLARIDILAPKVASFDSARAAAGSLRDASGELGALTLALEREDIPLAKMRGERALASLLAAEGQLEEALRKEARTQLERMSELASQLASRQRSEAASSKANAQGETPNADEKAAAKSRQDSLRQEFQRLREETSSTLASLSRNYPEAASSLTRAMDSTMAETAQNAQTRASNALLYGRFDRAAKSQGEAADAIEHFARELDEASSAIPRFNSEELIQALESLQELAEMAASATTREELGAAREAASSTLKSYGREFGLEELTALGQDVAANARDREELLQRLDEAAYALRTQLERLRRNDPEATLRKSTPLPRKFRPQTQEYFRQLMQE